MPYICVSVWPYIAALLAGKLSTVQCKKMHILSEIWIYPIKSMGGIPLQKSNVEARGLQYDRRWMLVNPAGRFVSQREIPELALLRTAIEAGALIVFHKDRPLDKLHIPLDLTSADLTQESVTIWDDTCTAAPFQKPVNDWFSAVLGQELRLVMMPETTRRWADEQYAPKGQHVSFADGFPYLIIGQASLDELNARLQQPLPMNRFRPNFVFTGGEPFEEDKWSDFQVGTTAFRGVKPCARCIIPTTDQETAQRAAEPLKTLATYRTFGHKIFFGLNVLWMGEGAATVRVGDALTFG